MIPALTISKINEYCATRYDTDEKRIVAIMIARYTIPFSQDMIKQQYDFWHHMTGRYLDIFWLGYGAYHIPKESGQYLVGEYGNQPNVYFDTNVFIKGIEELKDFVEIKDEIGVLLCNYYNGRIHCDESVFFNLEEIMDNNNPKLRMFADYLLKLCKKEHDVSSVTVKLKIKYSFLKEKPTSFIKEAIKTIIENALPFLFK